MKRRKAYLKYLSVFALGFIAGLALMILSSYFRYDYQWIIGKHYEEIIENYGEFDSGNAEFVDEDRRYGIELSNGRKMTNAGTYEIQSYKDRRIGPNDRRYYPHIIIEFNKSGYAISISKGYLYPPGG